MEDAKFNILRRIYSPRTEMLKLFLRSFETPFHSFPLEELVHNLNPALNETVQWGLFVLYLEYVAFSIKHIFLNEQAILILEYPSMVYPKVIERTADEERLEAISPKLERMYYIRLPVPKET